MTSTVPASL
jgi:hypothetical protein